MYDRKLVRRDHLEIISPSYRNTGDNRTLLLNRAITKMFRCLCFDKIHERQEIGKGNTPSIVALDRAGSIILGVSHKRRIAHHTTIFKGQEYIERSLPSNYKHINGVNQIEVDTILFCDDSNFEIARWGLEISRNYTHNGEDVTFIPDVIAEIMIRGKKLLLFLEYDTGSEDLRNKAEFPTLYNKLVNYKRYYKSKIWGGEFERFPMILLVTEDDKRIPFFNKSCKELGLEGWGVYYESYVKFLTHLAKLV